MKKMNFFIPHFNLGGKEMTISPSQTSETGREEKYNLSQHLKTGIRHF